MNKWTVLHLDSCGFFKLISQCNFSNFLHTLPNIIQNKTIKEACREIFLILRKIPPILMSLITEETTIEQNIRVWDITTRRHKTILSEKWLMQMGVLQIFVISRTTDKNPRNRRTRIKTVLRKLFRVFTRTIKMVKYCPKDIQIFR